MGHVVDEGYLKRVIKGLSEWKIKSGEVGDITLDELVLDIRRDVMTTLDKLESEGMVEITPTSRGIILHLKEK